MNNKSSKKHMMMRDIPKFSSTKCFCDDGNLFKVLKTSFMRQIFGSCSVLLSILTSVYGMQCKNVPKWRSIRSQTLSFSLLLLLLQQANKQREKRQNKKMLAERRSWRMKISCPTLHSCWFSGRKGRIWLAQKIKLFKGWPNLIHTKIGVCLFVCMIIVTKPWSALNHGAPLPNFVYFQKAL